MTVETTDRKQIFDGGQSELTFTFKALTTAPEDIKVLKTLISSGVETALTYDVDYTVSLESDGVGGVVTVSPTVSTLYTMTVYRETTDKQESDYDDYNSFPADTLERDLDRRTLVSQERSEEIARAIKLPISSLGDPELPAPVANNILGWNAAADGIENKVPADFDFISTDPDTALGTSDDKVPTQNAVRQYIADRMINVLDYGAAGDGSTNDLSAIEDAISACPTGGTIFLPAGNYYLGATPLTITGKSLVLKGEGSGYQTTAYGTRISYVGTGSAIRICSVSTQAYNITLEDLALYGADTGVDGIKIGSATVAAENKAIGHLVMNRVSVTNFAGAGLQFAGINWGSFNDCHFDYNVKGVNFSMLHANNSNNVLEFNNCTMNYNDEEGVYLAQGGDITFNHCTLGVNGYEGIKINSAGSRQVDNVTIKNCWFEGNQVDAGRTSGYYQILVDSTTPGTRYVGRIALKSNSMRGVENASADGLATGNGQVYVICSELLLENTAWASVPSKPLGFFGTIVTHLISEDIGVWKWSSGTRVEGHFSAFTQTKWGGTSSSGTGEDDLESFVLPANHFSAAELLDITEPTRQYYQRGGAFNTFRILANGTKTGSGGNKTIKLYFGSNVLATIGPANDTLDWAFEVILSMADSASNLWYGYAKSYNNTTITFDSFSITQDITADITVKVTGECANAGDVITNLIMSVKPW